MKNRQFYGSSTFLAGKKVGIGFSDGAHAAASVAQARKRFEAWHRWVRTEAAALTAGWLEPVRKAADMVKRHLEGIPAHWRQGLIF